MKLLLTSGGITNPTIAKALIELAGKSASEINIAFIPTAMNPTENDKSWFIDNLYQLKEQKYKMIDIVDISALPRWNWQPRLEGADVLFFSGGTSQHLMRWLEESGLKELLPELLKTRVYVGVSAGSVVASPTLALSNKEKTLWYKEKFGYEAKEGLGFIDFYIRPHLNATKHPQSSKEVLKKIAQEIPQTIYGIDDQMAIKMVDGKMEVIGEGEYIVFNKLF
ncbi:MAG: Type 1 glutamine amidotransferase-like domain-containing protein [Patescibacteria group bacterium]